MDSDIPHSFKAPIEAAIQQENWGELIEAFDQELDFGTSGIREKLTASLNDVDSANDLYSLVKSGTNAIILRGSNTINEVTVTKYARGLAKFMRKHKMTKLVLGFDSRINNVVFSHIISKILLENGLMVFTFSRVTSLPELIFAVKLLKADLGLEITASHNDKRYNGLKLITSDGGPPNNKIKNELAKEFFSKHNQSILTLKIGQFDDKIAGKKLIYLNENSSSKTKQALNVESKYISHIKNFIFQYDLVLKNSMKLKLGYSAIHGTGYAPASRLFRELGFKNVRYVSAMNSPDPMFSSFKINQILDPGDPTVANVVITEFIKQYGKNELENLDVFMYNDPDADRLGVITKVSKIEEQYYGKWKLHKADTIWTLLLWYILENLSKADKYNKKDLFIVKSYVTNDSLFAISKKYGIECENGRVGFSDLSQIVRKKWKKNKINVGMFEESNGFGFAGNPLNSDIQSHTLEKDGILALALITEIAAYAKSKKTSIPELLDNLYLDPDVGYYATFRTQIPDNGIFEGVSGELHKQRILKFIETIAEKANNDAKTDRPFTICEIPVSRVEKYSTGKYDKKYWNNFADEGIRFFLGSNINHVTIRPSGTESKIRIFSQYKIENINRNNLLKKKFTADKFAADMANEMKRKICQAK
jgi:phosphoglucomutase